MLITASTLPPSRTSTPDRPAAGALDGGGSWPAAEANPSPCPFQKPIEADAVMSSPFPSAAAVALVVGADSCRSSCADGNEEREETDLRPSATSCWIREGGTSFVPSPPTALSASFRRLSVRVLSLLRLLLRNFKPKGRRARAQVKLPGEGLELGRVSSVVLPTLAIIAA